MRIPGIPYVQGRNAYTDRDGRHYGIAIHDTANTASAEGEAAYATGRTDGVSAHFYVDSDSIVQSLDTNSRAGHAGSYEGNEHAIAVEITGLNSWTRQQWLDRVAWDKLGAALAYIITHDPDYEGFQVRWASVSEMQANPKVKAFYTHDDMRRAWGGTTHTDPGPNFPKDRLIQAVNAALAGGDDDMDAAQFLALLKDPKVSKEMSRLPWAYNYFGRSSQTVVLAGMDELAAAEAREVARDAAQTALIQGLVQVSGTTLTAEQLAALTAAVREAAAAAGQAVLDRLGAAAKAEADALGAS